MKVVEPRLGQSADHDHRGIFPLKVSLQQPSDAYFRDSARSFGIATQVHQVMLCQLTKQAKE